MIQPVLRDDAWLDDVAKAREQDALHLWWLGQSGFLVQWRDRHLLLDPYLSDSLTRKYAATDKPHVRISERVVSPERLTFIDVVTSTHSHTDHLDAETLGPLAAKNPGLKLIAPEAERSLVAERSGIGPERLLGMDDGVTVEVEEIRITGIPAAHEKLERDHQDHHRFLGYVIQFGPCTLYHAGDTMMYDGIVERLRPWHIDIAMLPINGRAPERRVAGNLDGREAAALAHEIGAGVAIPCHYDMFAFNTASPAVFVEACAQLGQPCRVLQLGERFTWAEK